jgi:hypothetical protein
VLAEQVLEVRFGHVEREVADVNVHTRLL